MPTVLRSKPEEDISVIGDPDSEAEIVVYAAIRKRQSTLPNSIKSRLVIT
jgi:hypothetical protein